MEENSQQPETSKREVIIAVVVLAVVVVLALVGYSMISSAPTQDQGSTAQQYALNSGGGQSGQAASAEILSCAVVSSDAQDLTLGQVSNGKPMVVNLWATWCPYCVAEMADYQKLYEKYGDRLQFVMLNVCDTAREVSLARDYIAEEGFTFPVYYDADHQVKTLLGVTGYPTTAIVSDTGEILMNRAGQINYDNMDATLAAVLG